MTDFGPKDKERLSCGVLAVQVLKADEVLVGAGDGTVAIIKIMQNKFKKKA